MKKNTEQGELAKYDLNSNGCWIWRGYKDKDGYGETSVAGKGWKLHRLSYHYYKGELKKGMMICHTCDTPACHNPDHLYQGTALDNNRDRAARNKEGPKRYQETMAARAGLDVEKVNAIYRSNEYPGELGEHYGVHKTVITRIRTNKGFVHLVTDENRLWRASNPLPNFCAKTEQTRAKLGAAQLAYQATLDEAEKAARMVKVTAGAQAARKVHNWNCYGRI